MNQVIHARSNSKNKTKTTSLAVPLWSQYIVTWRGETLPGRWVAVGPQEQWLQAIVKQLAHKAKGKQTARIGRIRKPLYRFSALICNEIAVALKAFRSGPSDFAADLIDDDDAGKKSSPSRKTQMTGEVVATPTSCVMRYCMDACHVSGVVTLDTICDLTYMQCVVMCFHNNVLCT